jgi:hypothetical protein
MVRGAEVLPRETASSGLPPARLEAAAEALRSAGRRWAGLRPGTTETVVWAASRRRR